MIDLTVKTLDSQNHAFSLNDDITVKQFKDRIAETINIPASTQRLIYCGRVLQDEKLLNEYDVNGKVIHLVQRAPPSVTQRSSNASQSQGQSQASGGEGGGWSQLPRIHYRQFHGNPMYVSSVSIPSDVLEGREWLVRPNTPNNGVRRHITVIRQMLNQANSIIDRLDNTPSAPEANLENISQSDETPRETSDVETDGERSELPVSGVNIALARVHNDGTLEPILVSMNAAQSSQTDQQPQQPQQQPPQETSQQSTAFNEELNDQTESTDALIPRVLAELLEKLLTTQERLNPYIRDRLLATRNLPELVEDAALARENQQVFDRVTECLHCLSHAQHALSNLTIDMRQSPRLLRCRPMSINSPPMLQAGVPIQVEAHISLHGQNDNPNFDDNNSATRTDTQSTETPTSTNAETSTSRTTSSTSSQPQSASDQQNTNSTNSQQQHQSNSPLGTLFNISNNVEVVMEMGSQFGRAWDFATNSQNRPSNSNNTNNSTNNNNNENGSNNNNTNSNSSTNTNTNREFGDNQSWASGQSPDTIRNFVQIIAGYMAQHGLSIPIPVRSTPTPITQGSARRRTVAVAFAESPNSGQNSQTRGNTETHPTTSTQTRTTPRTHMFHQRGQARGAGLNPSRFSNFDPLLVCTSYHFRRNQTSPSSSAASTQTGQTNRSTSTQVSTQSQTATTASEQGRRCVNRDQLQQYIFATEPSLNESFALAARISTPENPISLSWLLRRHGIHMESTDSKTTSRALNLLYMIADVLFEIPVHTWTEILNGYSEPLDNALIKLCQMLPSLYDEEITPSTATLIADDICSVIRPHLKNAFVCPRCKRNGTVINIEEVSIKLIHKHIRNLVIFLSSSPRSSSTNCLTLLNEFGTELVSVIRYVLKDFVLIISRFARSVALKWRPALRKWSIQIAGIWFYSYSLKVRLLPESEITSLLVSETDSSEPAATSSDSMGSSESAIEPMEVDTTSDDQPTNDPLLDGEEVPTTFPGHNNLLPDWVPIIARDGARQRRQLQLGLADSNSTTFSDAYLSTMPSKRRKLVEQKKPSLLVSPTPNHSVISASIERLVRESVERAGVEEVDGAIAALVAEPTVRRAFGLAIRESLVPGRFQTPDFPDPLRFPNATKFFANPSRSPK
ncbi:large proline-rich protein BAG6 [Chelonus insularis]|uniref:large proline-rich protein BAG6 n=1 Tax=Chelonus insularis TaxID=460826 RepID=UPI00158D72E2|nr:large proline-rich protein BAG6 [Chelonus insularis]XP_034942690.1 large proline-rich protein BAG6 [Chelonus insularis]XP_034942691.1 large proline-rich protein BAG6 [Chelonus insularis]XP_034942692.1 large proline-rich protein BAG6 [Chelonus insularis]XP_034942693.1 large proline-rich protein BAG6 [Chelonus insularis]